MTLKQSNPYLRKLTPAQQRAALRVSVESSSAIEGIRAPFTSKRLGKTPSTKDELIAQWLQRGAANSR